MDRIKPVVLLTGFEPFGGSAVNPSQEVVRALATRPWPSLHLETAVLPVERERGPAALLTILAQVEPAAVICLGEARHRARLSIERVALNLLDYGIPDNAGLQVADEPVVAGGPAAYFATLPVKSLLEILVKTGVPAELSTTAGTYLCNQVMYTLLNHIHQSGKVIPAGFIHLPALPEQVAKLPPGSPVPSMALEVMVKGMAAILEEVEVWCKDFGPAA